MLGGLKVGACIRFWHLADVDSTRKLIGQTRNMPDNLARAPAPKRLAQRVLNSQDRRTPRSAVVLKKKPRLRGTRPGLALP